MSVTSWLSVSLFQRSSGQKKVSRRQAYRRPTRSRPFLEHLEERTLLDGSGVVPGADILASNFAPISIGLALPIGPNFPSSTGVTAQTYPNAGGATSLAVTSAFVSQGQAGAQFRDFAVNSQGENNQLSQTTANILLDAYGFGSGVQPNAPWAPAAYNLGLGNHQFGYPSQSDLGSSATPPWYHRTGRTPEPKGGTPVLRAVEQASPLFHQAAKDREQDQQRWTDEDAHDKSANKFAPSEKPATKEQTVPEEAAPALTRGDPAVEEALFTKPLHSPGKEEGRLWLATLGGSVGGQRLFRDGRAAEQSAIQTLEAAQEE
ncbi:MAG: hypothetical protein ACRELF_08660 [Gemmataceae bacterium]